MPEDVNAAQSNAAESAESGATSGEPEGSTAAAGESVQDASEAKGEPSGEGLFDGMTGEQLHKSYKSMQAEFTKNREALKQFDQFGGAEQTVAWAKYLQENPRFADFVKAEQNLSTLGIDESQLDDQAKQTLSTVRNIADQSAEIKARQLLQREIEPLSTALKEQLMEKHFESMDKKYGTEWHEMRDTMSELSENLPDSVHEKPKFGDVEDLYFKALRETGKFDSYAAKLHERKLKEKKAKSTEKPATAGESAPQDSSTMADAFAAAKRAHNMT